LTEFIICKKWVLQIHPKGGRFVTPYFLEKFKTHQAN
jgi:hypothetical protein